jgi:UDP-N-acetylmuramoyl-L-alanyl-D-glutamate--2,6-diaminopimelate ligase
LSQPTRPVAAAAPWAEGLVSVGITGTKGKTTTTRMLASILRAAGEVTLELGTIGTFVDDEQLPRGKTFADFLAACHHAVARGARHAVLELTSLALAQGYARAWRVDMGVFTNLSPDHLQTHGSWEHYLAAKAQLFVHLGPGRSAVLNAGDTHAGLLDRVIPPDVERRWFHAPQRGPALATPELAALHIEPSRSGTRITLAPSPLAAALGGTLEIPSIGEVFGENALAAALAGHALGLPSWAIIEGLAHCPPVPGRFEVVSEPGQPLVAIDYAHTADALERTAASARSLAGSGRLIVVFGAGGNATASKRGPMGEVVGRLADLAIVTNDNPRDEDPLAIATMLAEGVRAGGHATLVVELDRARAIELALARAGPDDVVVIAGKGHEQGQLVRGVMQPFSDAEVARRQLAQLSRS